MPQDQSVLDPLRRPLAPSENIIIISDDDEEPLTSGVPREPRAGPSGIPRQPYSGPATGLHTSRRRCVL